mmetsp:Transcript_47458/g.122629  ORF Transcript_47458/g.122629 Transcript_47458/m.122629 type:complete len:91 (-) Transcript_47458:179-451(-)
MASWILPLLKDTGTNAQTASEGGFDLPDNRLAAAQRSMYWVVEALRGSPHCNNIEHELLPGVGSHGTLRATIAFFLPERQTGRGSLLANE